MESKPKKNIAAELRVIDAAYAAIVGTDGFDELISAWDDAYLPEDGSVGSADGEFHVGLSNTEKHFARALKLKSAAADETHSELQTLIDGEVLPSFIFDDRQRIIARNHSTSAISLPEKVIGFDELEAHYGTELVACLRELALGTVQGNGQTLVRSYGNDGRSYCFYVSVVGSARNSKPRRAILVQAIEAIWTNNLRNVLSSAFNLTEAEIETTRLLALGHTAAQVADVRERSLETVRNQIRSILSKSQAGTQVELVRMLTLLGQVSKDDRDSVGSVGGNEPGQVGGYTRHVIDIDGRKLEYARYGKSGGLPLLYIATSSLPEETFLFRRLMQDAGLEVIAPYRPGFASSSRASHGNSPEGFSQDCIQLLNIIGIRKAHVAGHREGGIFAARIARNLGERALSLSLINTGAPVVNLKSLQGGSLVAWRSLYAAIKAPKALMMGYRLAARLFASGTRGEAKIMDFFYSGSPIDLATYSDPQLRETTRRNLEYCFQNPDDIVRDVHLWATDWSADLRAISDRVQTSFIHAEEHDFMLADKVKAFCSNNPAMNCEILPLSGQTMLYTHTRRVVAGITKQSLSPER
ncbi:MAG: hypothetical protein AAF141_01600 [Pseudomonadota bacterium]